jgi:hypothetical protein
MRIKVNFESLTLGNQSPFNAVDNQRFNKQEEDRADFVTSSTSVH